MNQLSILLVLLSLHLISCQSNNNETILEIIEKKLNSRQFKLKYESIGVHGGYGILKKYYILNVLEDEILQESNNETMRKLDALVFNKLIKVGIRNEKSFINTFDEHVTTKDLIIMPTEKGKELIVGETTERFIFNIYDLKKITLVDKPVEKSDSIFVKYTIGQAIKTDAYNCLAIDFQTTFPEGFLNDTLECIFLKQDKKMELIKIGL